MPHLVDELLDNLAVQELERPLPLLDERDGNAQRREHRGVLDSDNTAAHYGHGPGNLLEVDHVVARDDDLAVGGDAGWGRRLRPHGNHDVLGRDSPPTVALAHLQGVRVGERGLPPDDRHVIAAQLSLDDVLFAREDLADLGRLDGGALAGGAASDAYEVVVVRSRHYKAPDRCALPDRGPL